MLSCVLLSSAAYRVSSLFFLLGAFLACSTSLSAQTAVKTTLVAKTDVNLNDTLDGAILASDGNFYTTSIASAVRPLEATCPDGNSCSYIYRVTPQGTVTVVHTFEIDDTGVNTDGMDPNPLVQGTDGNLYGSAKYGGAGGLGTIFRITLTGDFTLLYTFPLVQATGETPSGLNPDAIIQGADGNFYGTATYGGPVVNNAYTVGTVFRITPAGDFTTIYAFKPGGDTPGGAFTNPNGAIPANIVQGSDGKLYGTTLNSGYDPMTAKQTGQGTAFSLTTDGTLTTLHDFAYDGSEGASPQGPFVEGADGNFYGTTGIVGLPSGTNTTGNLFRMTPGGAVTVLHTFTGGTDGKGADPNLTLASDGNFYGTTVYGGNPAGCPYGNGCGTFFQMTPSGGLKTLYSFTGGDDGGIPFGPLALAVDGSFVGTTEGSQYAGTAGFGSMYNMALTPAIAPPIQLAFTDPTSGQMVTTVGTKSAVTLTWQVRNAFSLTMQQCFASVQGSPTGAGSWTGVQSGKLVNGIFTGTTTVTPTVAGTYIYALTCGGRESGFATLTVGGIEQIENTTLPEGNVGEPYSVTLVATDGTAPYTWSIDSVVVNPQARSKLHAQDTPPAATLPQGLSLNPTTGVISGTPQQAINAQVTVAATDSATPPHRASATLPLVVNSTLQLVTTSLVKGTVGGKYKQTLAAIKGVAPYTWSVKAGVLPDGLTLDANSGLITGQPTKEGATSLTFQVADSEPTPATKTATMTLTIKPNVEIAAVEFTQAIQQFQTLDDLNAALKANSEPPVPMVTGKPAVMRVYFTSVKDATTVTLTATGTPAGTKTQDLPPNCAPTDARGHVGNCPSVDIYFTPQTSPWTTTLKLTDAKGNDLETETFTVKSRNTYGINLKGVKACVRGGATGCSEVDKLLTSTGLTQKLWPTASVTASVTASTFTNSFATALSQSDRDRYLDVLSAKASRLFIPADGQADATNKTRTAYVAIYPRAAGNAGAIATLPGHGLVIGDAFTGDITPQPDYLAHEFGHTINERHTNNGLPRTVAFSTPPGCYAVAQDSDTTWPFANNNVQSNTGLEYGFDVTAQTVVDPSKAYDIMGYCVPDWVSPINYKLAFNLLGGGTVTSPSVVHAQGASAKVQPLVAGQYWQVSGSIATANGVATAALDPVFTQTIAGSSDSGSGTWSIQVRDQAGHVLYTRYFTPTALEGDAFSTDDTNSPDPVFAEWIPVTAGAASIAVLDASGNPAGTVTIAGTAPTVTITSPGQGFSGSGPQTVSWTVQSASSTSFTSRIFYSSDAGQSYQLVDETTDTSDSIDFSALPGSNAALIRIDVSDGINTGSATSSAFAVARSLPSTIAINSPLTGSILPAANPVVLSGVVYDTDDGVLAGTAIKWSDDVEGALGTGSPLTVTLKPGTHTITLTGTDSDGNSITSTTRITLGGDPPVVSINTSGSGCGSAVINAVPGANGADLASVNYSFDGGVTYTAIGLNALPFTVPGSGAINLVATAIDASGQIGAQSAEITLGTGCGAQSVTATSGGGQTAVTGQPFQTPLTVTVTDGSGKGVSGIAVTFTAPGSGASAVLSAATATTGSDGTASVTATANQTAGSYSITANVTGVTTPATFNLTNTAPAPADFQVTASSGSLTVSRGSSVTDTLSFTALNGFASPIKLSCSGLPAATTCSFSPATLTPGSGSASSELTITVSGQVASLEGGDLHGPGGAVLACGVFALWPLFLRRKRLSGLWILTLIAISTVMVGCGGSSLKTTHTTVTITAQSGSITHNTTIALTIK